jgi:hypothetical protein
MGIMTGIIGTSYIFFDEIDHLGLLIVCVVVVVGLLAFVAVFHFRHIHK